jgi:hypothetical protein
MAETAVSLEQQLNRYLCQKQGLRLEQERGACQAVHDLIGLYGAAPTCYLSLLARIPAFSFQALDAEVVERRNLIRIRAMRDRK